MSGHFKQIPFIRNYETTQLNCQSPPNAVVKNARHYLVPSQCHFVEKETLQTRETSVGERVDRDV